MPETTPALNGAALIGTATAVVALGSCQADIDLLDDVSLQAGMRAIAAHELELQRYKLWLAATIARRSDHTLGYQGLARKQGFPTPAVLIQSLTGSTIDDANRLARMGAMVLEAEKAVAENTPADPGNPEDPTSSPDPLAGPGTPGGSSDTAITTAAQSGGISIACADAIRKGLGNPDAAVTTEQLRIAAEKLIAHAQLHPVTGAITPEGLLKLARQARAELDTAAVERGDKERAAARYVRTWERDGFYGGSWQLTAEDGGSEINTALKLLIAKQTGGPRFPDTDSNGNPIQKTAAEAALEDERTLEQILADGFIQIFHNGITADPTIVPGAARAAVRVMVTEHAMTAATRGDRTGTALLEENLTPITLNRLEEYLCEGGTIGILFHPDGTIDVGREQRLYTRRQRTALGVRDGGCRYPGCPKPPSWCEAHHINYWARDHGRTDTKDGILLCRYHHGHIHKHGWEIIRNDTTYWLKPPTTIDPTQTLIEMPTKNPLAAAMQHTQHAS